MVRHRTLTPTLGVQFPLPLPLAFSKVINKEGVTISNATQIALGHIQRELKVGKNRDNKFGGYKFRSCEDIMEAVKPLLDTYHATLIVNDGVELIGEHYYIVATATFSSTEEGADPIHTTAYARESEEQKGMQPAQCTGAASSYARKYCLSGLFCLDDTKDPDAMSGSTRGRKPGSTNKKNESNVSPELKQAQQGIVNLAKSLMTKGISKDEIYSIISKNNNGNKLPSRIESVEQCEKIAAMLKELK